MRARLSFLVPCLIAITAFPGAAWATSDTDYHAVTTRIFARIGALKIRSPAIDWSEEIKKATVAPDGSGGFSIERDVEWVLDRPTESVSKRNARRAVFKPGGFWIRLTFYRGPWTGAAMFQSIDFGDLHLWFDYGYKDDATVISAIARIVDEERRAFEKALQARPTAPGA